MSILIKSSTAYDVTFETGETVMVYGTDAIDACRHALAVNPDSIVVSWVRV